MGGAAVIALGSSASFLALYTILLLPVLALMTLLLYPAFVRVWPACEQRYVFREDNPKLSLRFRNLSPLAYPDVEVQLWDPYVEYQPEDPEDGLRLSLPALGHIDRKFTLRFPFRGIYDVGVKEAKAVDFLGLFRLRFKGSRPQRVTVFPKLIEGFQLPLSGRQVDEGDVGHDHFADQTIDVSDVRKHDPGDDYRRVHWKLTAKRGEFIVKNFRTPGLTRTIVLLDTAQGIQTGRMKLGYDDLMVSLAASALDCCMKNRQAARLIYGEEGGSFLDVLHPDDMEPALELLAVLPLEGPPTRLTSSLHALLLSRQSFADLAVFAGTIDEALCDLLKSAFQAGHAVFFHYIYSVAAPTKEAYALLDGLAAYGINVEIIK